MGAHGLFDDGSLRKGGEQLNGAANKAQEIAPFLDRVREVAQASHQNDTVEAGDGAALQAALQATAHHAPLYFRFAIPSWPPRLLLRKILRRVLSPFWTGQVHFNEATRDALHGLARQSDRQNLRATHQQKRIEALEREIADLHVLVRQIAAAPSETAAIVPLSPAPNADTGEETWPVLAARAARELDAPASGAPSPLYFGGLDEGRTVSSVSKPRAAFISPFPPVQSGVADYSAEIIGPLADHYELDLYTDDGYAPRLPAPFSTYPLSAWEKNLHLRGYTYQTAVYQLGNNALFHGASYFLLLRYAGITVLHDYLLTHMIGYMCVDTPHLGLRFHDELIYEVGKARADQIMHDYKGPTAPIPECAALGIAMNRRVFTRSLGVALHNQWSYEQAQKDRAHDNELITLIPPVMPPVKLDQTRDDIHGLRQKWGVPLDAFVFAPCGIVTQTKRPLPILDAFARLLAERPDAFLLFVGSVSMPPRCELWGRN